jgi:caa(3)-type oxidase subunit IV
MTMHDDLATEERLQTVVFACLAVLTLATAASSMLHPGRILGITLALSVAGMKAGLIGFYFMQLRRERPLVWVSVLAAVTAVLILIVGLIPDTAVNPR